MITPFKTHRADFKIEDNRGKIEEDRGNYLFFSEPFLGNLRDAGVFRNFWADGLCPKGPKIEKNRSRLKMSIPIENFNPDLQNSPQKIGVCWVARLKNLQSRLKISIPEGDLENVFQSLGPWGADGLQFGARCRVWN